MRLLVVSAILVFLTAAATPVRVIFKTVQSNVKFSSEAPLEMIKAESTKMVGLIDSEKNNFAFQIAVISFQGFNSELQREHFNENYMESTKFPKLKFVGKILDEVDYNSDFDQQVTVDGTLTVHGVSKKRKFGAKLAKKQGKLFLSSDFDVLLADHNIKIPTIVNQKLAKVISVHVNAEMVPK